MRGGPMTEDPILTTGPAFGLLGGMVAWTLHLGLSYALVPFVCAEERTWVLHLLTGGTALIAGAAMVLAWRAYRRGETEPPESSSDEGGGVGKFLAISGVFLSGFFLLLILVEGLPVLFQGDPCGATPTLDRPIIQREPGPEGILWARIHPEGLVPPGEWWTAWNLDPWLLGPIYTLAALYGTGVRRLWRTAGRGRGIPGWRVWCYFAGIATLLLALASPVDALGGTLFSVHMVQHMLLMVVAAPLLVLGRPMLGYLWALPGKGRRRVALGWRRFLPTRWSSSFITHPGVILLLHVAALWAWHVPQLYQAALANPWVHHLEHASFFFTALLFWWALAESGARGVWPGFGAGILYVFATALQSGALGALLLFAREPWYPDHGGGAALWGVDLLVDQQLAGAIMWIPAGLVYAGAAVVLFLGWMRQADEVTDRWEGRKHTHPPSVETT